MAAAGVSYVGPGDVVTGAHSWGSCARVYTTAQASTSTSLCDLVDSATPTVTLCTLRGSATGFADLTAYCPGSITPSAICAAATGGVCNIKQIYDQSGNSRHFTQTTAANQPTLVFSAIDGKPAWTCNGSSTRIETPTFIQAQPFTMLMAWNRTTGTAVGGIGTGSGGVTMGNPAVASQARLIAGGTAANFTGFTDAAWNGLIAAFNGASTQYKLNNGSVTTPGASIGTTGFVTQSFRLCTDGGNFINGRMAEAGMWPSALNATQIGNLYTNQNGTSGYNGAF
jgi:hypothetical protein